METKRGRPKGKMFGEKVSIVITTEMRRKVNEIGKKQGFTLETEYFRYIIQKGIENCK